MCLDRVQSEEELKKWLEDKPEIIECYKVVFHDQSDKCFTPIFCRNREMFYKRNICQDYFSECSEYKPFFHFIFRKEDALRYKEDALRYTRNGEKIFKCKVRRKDITAIGSLMLVDFNYIKTCIDNCIVAKEFEFCSNCFPQKTKIWSLLL